MRKLLVVSVVFMLSTSSARPDFLMPEDCNSPAPEYALFCAELAESEALSREVHALVDLVKAQPQAVDSIYAGFGGRYDYLRAPKVKEMKIPSHPSQVQHGH